MTREVVVALGRRELAVLLPLFLLSLLLRFGRPLLLLGGPLEKRARDGVFRMAAAAACVLRLLYLPIVRRWHEFFRKQVWSQ